MDFHSLPRKELQALCKKNKIPANITNVAMADALQALDKVEGLDEFINASKSESPEKTTNVEPKTAVRSSTRRNPSTVEPQTSQFVTRTRRTTRRNAAEEAGEENKNVNVLVTPAMPTGQRRVTAASVRRKINALLEEEEKESASEEKNDAPPETPAIQSTRRKATAVSTRKAKKDEKSVLKAYSTRHSVKLLEKSLENLSFKEAVKIEGLSADENEQVEVKDVPEDDYKIEESQQNNGEMEHEVHVDNSTNDDSEVADNGKQELSSESCNIVNAEDKDDDTSGKPLHLQIETSENAVEKIDEIIQDNDAEITVDSEIVSVALEQEIEKEEIDITTEITETVPATMEQEIKKEETDGTIENSEFVTASLEPEIEKEETDITIENSESVPAALEPETEKEEVDITAENSETVTSALGPEIEMEAIDKEESVLEPEIEKKEIDKEESILVPEVEDDAGNQEYLLKAEVEMEAMDNHESLIKEFCDVSPPVVMEIENASTVDAAVEISVAVADSMMPKLSEVSVEEVDLTDAVGESHKINLMENEHQCTEDMLSDSATEEDSDGNETEDGSDYESDDSQESEITEQTSAPFSMVSNSEVQSEEFAVAAHESTQTLDKSPLVSGSKVTVEMVSSPFAANSLQGLFPRPIASTTPRKSSTKKPAVSQKISIADINKENIDKSGRKVEHKHNKAKKNAIDENVSLRQLTKMLRGRLEKMKIADDKNTGVKNITEVGTRTALQILPENRIAAMELEQKN